MRSILYTLLLVTLGVTYAFSANLRGTVKDGGTGEPLIGANIVLAGTSMGTTTDADGFFLIPNLQPGDYTVEVSYLGYRDASLNVTIGSSTVTVDVLLESVAISASAINVVSNIARERETPVAFSDISKTQLQEQLGSRDIPLVLNTTPSVYSTNLGGGAGDARINVRGFSQRNMGVLINGVPVNDMENGWVYWSNWDGIGDAAKSIQVQRGLSAINLAVPSIGGTLNIITDPAAQQAGAMLKQEAGEYGFIKTTATFHTGLINDKYAFSATGVRKIGDGQVDKTWTDAWAYYFGASYNLNNRNRLELYAVGAPQRHGQAAFAQNIAEYDSAFAASLDDYDPAAFNTYKQSPRGLLYNENWGPISTSYTGKQSEGSGTRDRYSDGILNERENFFHKPQVNLNWYSQLSQTVNLYTVLYYSGGTGGGTGTYGSMTGQPFRTPNKQWDWDANIARNQAGDPTYGGSRGILRNSRNNQWTIGAIVKTEIKQGQNAKYTFGLDWRTAEIDHYREVRDLLGGDYYDARSRGRANELNQFWAADPSQYIRGLGDKINYDNTNKVNWIGGFGQTEFSRGQFTGYAMYGLSAVKYDYTDYFKAARKDATGAPDLSSGFLTLETDYILGYQLKGGANYRLNRAIDVYGNLGFVSKVPIFDQVIDDVNAIKTDDPQNEKFESYEAGMNFTDPEGIFTIKLGGYYTNWKDRVDLQTRSFITTAGQQETVSVLLSGIKAVHKGIEMEAAYKPNRYMRFDGAISLGNWEYTKDAGGEFRTFAEDPALTRLVNVQFALSGLKVGNAPQKHYAVSGTFTPIEGLRAQGVYRYYAAHYADFEPFDRAFQPGETPDRVQSWKIPSYGVVDLHMSYQLPVKIGPIQPRLFVNVFNLTDETFIQDALDNSQFNGFDGDHDADDAEVFFGNPRYINGGLQINL